MATFNMFYDFPLHLGQGKHDLANDVLEVYLSNTAASANDDSVKTDLAEIAIENNYTGPLDITNNWARAANIASMTATSVTWTANGGSFGPFDKVVLYNNTAANDELVGWWEYGSSIQCNNGESFTWATPANNEIANLTNA